MAGTGAADGKSKLFAVQGMQMETLVGGEGSGTSLQLTRARGCDEGT